MTSFDATSTPATSHGGRASTTLLKLQADERLVAHVRRGNQAAFEVLVARYNTRLLAFCRHMLGSGARRDAEDVLQEVFTSAYRAMLGDTRPINVRPWLYRIARNRCLNHLRRDPMPSIEGMEMTVVDERIGTADIVHQRAEVRQLLTDIQDLPEAQRTAILLREIDDLSYEQIAMAMDNTVAAVKSLLVRARVGLAEAAESRRLSCDDVRIELGEHAEGLVQKLTPATRRHLKDCKQCSAFQQDLKDTSKTLAMLAPAIGILALAKAAIAGFGHAGTGAAGAAGAGAAAAGGGGLISIGSVLSAKTMTGFAAAVAVTGAAVEVKHVATPTRQQVAQQPVTPASAPAPEAAQSAGGISPGQAPEIAAVASASEQKQRRRSEERARPTSPEPTTPTTPAPAPAPQPAVVATPASTPPATTPIEHRTDVVDVIPVETRSDTTTVKPPSTTPKPKLPGVPPKPAPPVPPSSPTTPAPSPADPPATSPGAVEQVIQIITGTTP